ncbi:hypothetical protein CL614_03940 [archaeon]|nr:hypothetical protein [archaeon]|tara:strand:+ start:1073 stop:1621 length:549 start_codon:yes stop_codon:yes gene_type:complete
MKVIAIIPAKGNSRRLSQKNIFPFNGKPMLYWAIKACKESKYNIEPWVSTEDNKVKEIALEYGAKIHDRDPRLSEPHVFKQEVIRSATRYIIENHYKPDIVISLQPNSPQIKFSHLDAGIDCLIKNKKNEIFSIGKDLMQNAAFRIMKTDYVFQRDLSTYCGVVICDIIDVHTKEDLNLIND